MEPDRQQAIELIERADLAMVDGRVEEARGYLRDALEVDPLNVEAKRMLAGVAVREAKARGEDTSDLPEQAELASIEAGDLKIAARRERAMGHDELADALARRALDMEVTHPSFAARTETPHYEAAALDQANNIGPVAGTDIEDPETVGGSPVTAVVWFVVGAMVGGLLLRGGEYLPYLPDLHRTLRFNGLMDIGTCGAVGFIFALLFGRRRIER